jgi:hypothetical protein
VDATVKAGRLDLVEHAVEHAGRAARRRGTNLTALEPCPLHMADLGA